MNILDLFQTKNTSNSKTPVLNNDEDFTTFTKVEYRDWNFENDYTVLDRIPLYTRGARPYVETGEAYIVDAENGTFCGVFNKTINQSIVLFNENGANVLFDNCIVICSDLKNHLMVFYCYSSGEVYLIDTRGILFRIDLLEPNLNFSICEFRLVYNKKTGFYEIGEKWTVRAISKEEAILLYLNAEPVVDHPINSKYRSFFNKSTEGSFFLSCSKGKRRNIVLSLIEKGMPYEVVPNMFKDDDSYNICIYLTDENLALEPIQFLLAKYENSYDIFKVPVQVYVANLNHIDRKSENTAVFQGGKADEKTVIGIIDSLRIKTDSMNDQEIYSKYFVAPFKAMGDGLLRYKRADNRFLVWSEKYNCFVKNKEAIEEFENAILNP